MSNQFYTVVCTDLNDYVNWQVELLEYSWSRSNQPGSLLRLIADDSDAELPKHRHAQTIRTTYSNKQAGSDDEYVCYNRLFSLQQWLQDPSIDGTVLVVDCDVVFTKPILRKALPGKPVAQAWLDYAIPEGIAEAIRSSSDVDLQSLQAVTWPMVIHTDDLRRLLARWIEMTIVIRQATGGQESDMYALLVAARELELEFQADMIAAFMPWLDEKVRDSELIHYCQVVKDNEGQRLWGKWRYQPWQPVANPEHAQLKYCRTLLALLNEFANIKNNEESTKTNTIFVAIASYCDAELVDTIESCLQKARHPENLRFGICHQFDNSDPLTNEHCLDRYSNDARFRYVSYPFEESEGGCWARNIAQQLYAGETYTLQVDAHTQMRESWDAILIDMMESLPSDKPLITSFPPLYTVESDQKAYQRIDDLTQVNSALAPAWSAGGWLEHTQKLIPQHQVFPRLTRVLSGAFVFTTGEWNETVRQDPEFLYVGEEFALTLRSFTHGYDLFDPSEIVCWHRLHPSQNRKFRNDNSSEVCSRKHHHAINRLQQLINRDADQILGRYALGTTRSLRDFAQLTGIDCIDRTVTEAAIAGAPIDPMLPPNANSSEIVRENSTADRLIKLTINTKHRAPLELNCLESTPVLLSLFQALTSKHRDTDEVIFLQLGETGQEQIFFKKQDLVSIKTSPELSDGFFSQLAELESNATQDAPQSDIDPATAERIPDTWKIWIWHNISRGVGKDDVYKQLLESGFSHQSIRYELNHELASGDLLAAPINGVSPPPKYQPNVIARRLDNNKLEIYQIDDFLDLDECQTLIELIKEHHDPSTVVSDSGSVKSKSRTSHTCHFNQQTDPDGIAESIKQRLCSIVGIDSSYAEALQGQLYTEGGEYKAHYDWFEPGTPSFYEQASHEKGGQRTWSVIVYLNHVLDGGETRFENADLTLYPRAGRAVFWNNLHADGTPSQEVLHQACPVRNGFKAILTLWFRSNGSGEMYTRLPGDLVPAYTPLGIAKRTMPLSLHTELTAFLKSVSQQTFEDEFVEGGYLQNSEQQVPSHLVELPDCLKAKVVSELLPICERWSQTDLAFSALYGMRIYARGTQLKMHTDTIATHIISVILNIAQEVDEDWPLEIDDHMGRRHFITMQPGEMILYEGARLAHGRPSPLKGNSFTNLFLHFHPKSA